MLRDKKIVTKQTRTSLVIFGFVIILIIFGHILFAQFADYTYKSDRHIDDLFRAKLWSFIIILAVAVILFWKHNEDYAPFITILGISVYFIMIYGILFRGTQYGLNGHWGDNGYRLAIICKMMTYNYFADAYMKDLTSMYPPLWFYIMAIYARIIGIEAWQTLKFGYLFLFVLYPWLIYFSWRPLISSTAAAVVAVGTIFFAHNYLDYIYYEHISASLFIPWWLYYFEDGKNIAISKKPSWKFYFAGIIIGGAIFMTYYYWFFIAIAAFPVTLAIRYLNKKSINDLFSNIRHKVILAVGVTILSSIYWLPILLSGLKNGFQSYQVTWFGIYHANIMSHWSDQHLEGILVLGGIFFAAYLWNRWHHAKLSLYYCGAVLLLIIDRMLNLGGHSIQTRKILEFTHVLTIAPLAIGLEDIWKKLKRYPNVRWGLSALAIILTLVFANDHLELYQSELYKTGVNQRRPDVYLDALKDVDYRNKVLLTDKYIEACYLPYFVFTPVSNVPAHLAGRYQQRKDYLKAVSQINEPDLLAYMFSYNKFDRIDYVYLPYNTATDCYEFRMNTVSFNRKIVFDTTSFTASSLSDSAYFRKINRFGLYEINAPKRNSKLDERIENKYPELVKYFACFDESKLK